NLIQWTSDLDGALGSGAARTITTLRPGVHTITARVTDAGGLVGQAKVKIQVGHAPEVAITAPTSGSVFYLRQLPITLRAAATDFEDGDLSRQIRWSSSRDGALGVGAAVSAGALSIGTHTLTATVTDSNGLVGEARVTIRVRDENAPPALTISAP